MEENTKYWIIILVLNLIIYGLCIFFALKRKNYTRISIRSPTLFLSIIVSNFLMNENIILNKISEGNFFSSFFYLFRFMMIVSILLRYERILVCCNVDGDIISDQYKFSKNRKKYIEKYYVKILLFCSVIFLVITIIILSMGKEYLEAFFSDAQGINKVKLNIWIIWNFLEQGFLLTYIFRIYNYFNLQYLLKVELYAFLIIWFIYDNFSFLYAYIAGNDVDNSFLTIVTMLILYICLVLNGFVPIISSFGPKALVFYNFPGKLINNLYLFLSNENCYIAFNNYLMNQSREDGQLYLKLYTYIMRYRFNFILNNEDDKIFNEANAIYNIFFNDDKNSKFISTEILLRIREEYKTFNQITKDRKIIFDEALQFTFIKLNEIFKEFKCSNEFQELNDKINIASYVNCKMYNTGLINKF